MRPVEYKFSSEVKKQAKERAGYRCEICGSETALQFHHRVAIWFAKELPCLSSAVISSLANAQVVCSECHQQLHKNSQETKTRYAEEAEKILHDYLEDSLYHKQLDWREQITHVNRKQRRPVDRIPTRKVRKNRRKRKRKKRY